MAAPRVSLGVLKEPLGLSRGLQWFFSIFAFATCGSFQGSVTFGVTCAGAANGSQVTNVTAAFGYPFRLNQAVFQPSLTHLCNHTWPRDVHLLGDFSSAARFFVGVAVAAFLYSLGALGAYLGYLHLYRWAGSRLPLLDLLLSGLLAALWLVASSAWAQALGHVRAATAAPLPHCPSPTGSVTCARVAATPMGSLGASVAFGFLNLLLWAGGSWFVYKETPLHRPAPPPDPAPSPM
ncbi:synaptophysin-like protein 1 [Haemorhous mexicanus]|uniref:synaptophysin-like protein 1 n=1 Tax=Haemorhous mexicanus TaxID=30427 RepID=UPI0028BDD155|nr:synaptophysin-like protein 1 [Haemorhous mexicanus]